jgi:hypothetical protein
LKKASEKLYAKNKKICRETFQDNRHRKNDAAHSGLSASARVQEHKSEATRFEGQARGGRSRGVAQTVSSFWTLIAHV